jgi:enediyne biosynthesis protein E4
VDVLVNCINDVPQLLRCDTAAGNNWVKIKAIGVKSNRSGIGTRIYCTTGNHRQIDEVRSGGSYLSQGDFRTHFGLGKAETAEIEVHWPSGVIDRFTAQANRIVTVEEGKGPRGESVKPG